MDRSDLGEDWCALSETVEEFQRDHGIPYSKSSCTMVLFADAATQCTSLPYFGIRATNRSTPECLPKDVLFGIATEDPLFNTTNLVDDQSVIQVTESDPCR